VQNECVRFKRSMAFCCLILTSCPDEKKGQRTPHVANNVDVTFDTDWCLTLLYVHDMRGDFQCAPQRFKNYVFCISHASHKHTSIILYTLQIYEIYNMHLVCFFMSWFCRVSCELGKFDRIIIYNFQRGVVKKRGVISAAAISLKLSQWVKLTRGCGCGWCVLLTALCAAVDASLADTSPCQ
jgi:hypothetical protein